MQQEMKYVYQVYLDGSISRAAEHLYITQPATAYHLAEHGLAATFVSDRLVIGERDSLCYYKLDSTLSERLFYILLPERKYISFAVRTFIEYFKEQML